MSVRQAPQLCSNADREHAQTARTSRRRNRRRECGAHRHCSHVPTPTQPALTPVLRCARTLLRMALPPEAGAAAASANRGGKHVLFNFLATVLFSTLRVASSVEGPGLECARFKKLFFPASISTSEWPCLTGARCSKAQCCPQLSQRQPERGAGFNTVAVVPPARATEALSPGVAWGCLGYSSTAGARRGSGRGPPRLPVTMPVMALKVEPGPGGSNHASTLSRSHESDSGG